MNPNEKQWWVFTFSAGHRYGGHYVRFFGDYEEARNKMVKWFGRMWGAFQYSESEWETLVKRLTANGHERWIEKELTKIEYMQGLGIGTDARELNEGVFDENFAELIQTLMDAVQKSLQDRT